MATDERTPPVRVIVADDHPMFRRGVCAVLDGYSDQVQVIGEASNVEDTVRMAREQQPGLVLLDLQMPERRGSLKPATWEQGIAAIQRIKALAPSPRILVLSLYEEAPILFAALRAGAHGYITKGDSYDGQALADAICRTVAGEAIYGAVVAQRIRDYHQQRGSEALPPAERLTPREQEVLELLSDHKSNQEIAKELYISVKTVKTHVANILDKLHLDSRHEVPLVMRLRGRDSPKP